MPEKETGDPEGADPKEPKEGSGEADPEEGDDGDGDAGESEPFRTLSFKTEDEYRSFLRTKSRPYVKKALAEAHKPKGEDPKDKDKPEPKDDDVRLTAAQDREEMTDALLEAGIDGKKIRLARAALSAYRREDEDVTDAIDRLKADEPSWFGGTKETKKPGGTPGGRNQGTPSEDFSEAGLEKAAESMKPHEYRAWRRKNRAKIMRANGLAKRWNPGGNLLGAGQRKG